MDEIHTLEDNIKVYRKEIELEDLDWIQLGYKTVWWWIHLKRVTNIRIP